MLPRGRCTTNKATIKVLAEEKEEVYRVEIANLSVFSGYGRAEFAHAEPELSFRSTFNIFSEDRICLTTLSFSIALEFTFFNKEFGQTIS